MVVEVCTKGIAWEFLGRSVLSDFMTACADLFFQVVLMHLLALAAFCQPHQRRATVRARHVLMYLMALGAF